MSTIHAQLERIVNENSVKTQLVNEMSESVHIVRAGDAQRGAAQRRSGHPSEMEKVAKARPPTTMRGTLAKLPPRPRGGDPRSDRRQAKLTRPLNDKVFELALAPRMRKPPVLMKQAGPFTQTAGRDG
jgi:methyl-accepting chemotaxis protein